jgi:hypothetical protein
MELSDTANFFRTCVGIAAQPSYLFMNNTLSPTQEEIAIRAYHLFVDGGCQHGRDAEYWLQAEKELGSKFFSPETGADGGASNGGGNGAVALAATPKKAATKKKTAAATPAAAAEKPAVSKKAPAKKAAPKKKKAAE